MYEGDSKVEIFFIGMGVAFLIFVYIITLDVPRTIYKYENNSYLSRDERKKEAARAEDAKGK